MAHPWSLSPNAAEPPASARSLHPLLFPPHGKCICCDAEGDLVVRLLGGKRSHAHGTYFTLQCQQWPSDARLDFGLWSLPDLAI
jgi:hypothetical protein